MSETLRHVTCVEYLHAVPQAFEAASSSMRLEARAMLGALLEDFARLDSVRVTTLLGPERTLPLGNQAFAAEFLLQDRASAELCSVPTSAKMAGDRSGSSDSIESPRVLVHTTNNEHELLACLQRVASSDQSLLVVAPESDGILNGLLTHVERWAGDRFTSLNVPAVWAAVFGDKLQTFEWLIQRQLPAIPTVVLDPESADFERIGEIASGERGASSPGLDQETGRGAPEIVRGLVPEIVIKPRGSAGCEGVRVFPAADHRGIRHWLRENAQVTSWIAQPLVAGTPCSIAFVGTGEAGNAIPLPVTAQRIARRNNGSLHYQGGILSVATAAEQSGLSSAQRQMVADCQSALQRHLPAFRGYLGVDLVVTNEPAPRALVVEINPRLCTSYVGYRALACGNLADLFSNPRPDAVLPWSAGSVHFDESGQITVACDGL